MNIRSISDELSDFFHKSKREKLDIIIPILKNDRYNNFIEIQGATYENIAINTLKVMELYSLFNEISPIIVKDSELRVCFQPSHYVKNNFNDVVSYFAHMITGETYEGSKIRILKYKKVKAMRHIMEILKCPDNMYIKHGDKNKRTAFLFERKVAINSDSDNCHVVLFIEKMSTNMMRIVTILPIVTNEKVIKEKEKKSIKEIDLASLLKLCSFISPSAATDYEQGGELNVLTYNANIQNKLIENTEDDEIIRNLSDNQQNNFLNPTEMSQETIEKIEKLEKAINSPATPENIKDTMRKALEALNAEKLEVVTEATPYKTYSTIKSCLLDDGDDSDDYIYEGKRIHNVEVLPKDTWEIVEFYNYGVVLKHVPISVLADLKPNKNVSLDELKVLFASDKIEIDGIEKGNTKVFNLCIKAIIKCIDSLDMASYKENLLAELNESKNQLEKTIEASNLLASEKSNLEKETSDKIKALESDISTHFVSMEQAEKSKEEALKLKEEEAARLKKQIEDLEALSSMRTLIDMLQDDIAKKDFKENVTNESKGKIKVKSITIHSSEGRVEGYGFPKTFSSYEEANNALLDVLEDSIASNGYNNSANFTILFEDGQKYEGTVFISEKRSNPKLGNAIGKHVKSYLDFELSGNRQNEESKKEIREFLEKYDLGLDEKNLVIKDWYTKNYPSDDLGQNLNNDNTFNDIWNAIHNGVDVYSVLGVSDSIVRERVFEKLSEINGVEYDYVYNKWLNNNKYSDGGAVGYGSIKEEKEKMTDELFKKCGVFFAFSNEQFNKNKTPLKEGEKYVSIGVGGYMPKGNYAAFVEGMKSIKKFGKNKVKENNLAETEILYELNNHECFYTGDYSDVVDMFKGTYTREQIRDVYNKHFESSGTFEKGGKVKGTWGATFPEVGREGMYKGLEVIVTANRNGDILFDELDENGKVEESKKESLSEFRSYFSPFEPRETDVIYEKGGVVINENAQMILNENHQIKHHTEELGNIVNDETHVPAWVVSKVSDAANDLSDVTHYLDGEKNIN